MPRLSDLVAFYDLLGALEQKQGGMRRLANCNGRMGWPKRGVYFFFEEGEARSDSGLGPRVVRVGTHALTATSKTSLWNRLRQHRGSKKNAGGNHRSSIFRLLVGESIRRREGWNTIETWGIGSGKGAVAKWLGCDPELVRSSEDKLEQSVSEVIGSMPFLWLEIGDEPGSGSLRGYVERNAIALLSNYNRELVDSPSRQWLGQWCEHERVRSSGLWNNRHVEESYAPAFLDRLHWLIDHSRC